MIQFERDETPPETEKPGRTQAWPQLESGRIALCTIWTTGADPACDELARVMATHVGSDGQWHVLDLAIGAGEEGSPLARIGQGTDCELHDAETEWAELEPAWKRLLEFVGERLLLVPDAQLFERWSAALTKRKKRPAAAIGLVELTAMAFPGRLAARGTQLVADFIPNAEPRTEAGLVHPLELAQAVLELTDRTHALPAGTRALLCGGYAKAAETIREQDPGAARQLGVALGILDRPSAWAPPIRDLPVDGALSDAFFPDASAEDLISDLSPRASMRHEPWLELEPLPPRIERDTEFHVDDALRLDEIFEQDLPKTFAAEAGIEAKDAYREGQHSVAREVANCLGGRELLLVHAPTGTGKTLGYLIPAMLWARRHGIRLGISTYTRALQEQAMDREVPRALQAIAAKGEPQELRVSMLKGRENYLCWRSLKLGCPAADEQGEGWLAWTSLVLFALTDEDGDLDRFPARPPIALRSTASYRQHRSSFVRDARAQASCCKRQEHKATCAAELARRRAERSHLVITNHAFALSRQEFFRHMIFDECEHLHDQAHNAWSHTVSLKDLRDTLSRFHSSGSRSRALLDRITKGLVVGSPAYNNLADILDAWRDVALTLGAIQEQIEAFDAWRRQAQRGRDAMHEHSLLREYLESGGESARELIFARRAFGQSSTRFDAALAELAEKLDRMPVRSRSRVRRQLEQGRGEWNERSAAVDSWLPLQEGKPAFRSETFYDVEREARGDWVLSARVLLPNEFLGRHYFPNLANGVLMSATTHMGGSFGAAKGFLGLDRAAEPLEDEEREASVVRTHLSPEAFDYSRVLVAAPRDAPPISRDKEAHLAYVRNFLQQLGDATRGRILVLLTNAKDTMRLGQELTGFFRARRIPLWYQGMEGVGKEELGALFREHTDSILLGVDTFWYGADFPGETLEYLVIVRLPYGVPDGYHHAQCAALGISEQRSRIYLPRALAKIRQGFGRLMRRTTDRGCVFFLDSRILDPRHRMFLKELPLENAMRYAKRGLGKARIVRGDTSHCLQVGLEHMGIGSGQPGEVTLRPTEPASTRQRPEAPPIEIDTDDIPF
ncbi:MAG: ATP-dependent DNA helicase DinG [Planctomycetota bacterium]|jgi:ATP-dependent DNA helicase DinG